jgi:hypothetical protein
MAALEMISGSTTAAGAGPLAIGFVPGQTGVVRNYTVGNAYLLTMWSKNQVTGWTRVRSPRLHDNTQGIRVPASILTTRTQLPLGFPQKLVAQDTLVVEKAGSGVAGDIENASLLIYYDSLSGANGRYIDPSELERRIVNIFTITHAIVGLVAASVYGTAQALSGAATGDLMKANTDYALLGGTCSESSATGATSVVIQGVDTGNLVVGFPVIPGDADETRDWFIWLSKAFGRPLIPVVNAANKGGTTVAVMNDENANTVNVTTIWAELR